MAPNGDYGPMPEKVATFILSNAVPQDPNQNRQVWRELEENVRDLIAARGEAYIVTGSMFYDPAEETEAAGGNQGDKEGSTATAGVMTQGDHAVIASRLGVEIRPMNVAVVWIIKV
jgi:hypothetical protein